MTLLSLLKLSEKRSATVAGPDSGIVTGGRFTQGGIFGIKNIFKHF